MTKMRILISKILVIAFLVTNTLVYFPAISFAADTEKGSIAVPRRSM